MEMLLRLVSKSLCGRRQRVALAILAVVMGSAITSSLLTVSMSITDQAERELRAFGANIVVTPNSTAIPLEVGGVNFGSFQEQQHIEEKDLPKLKTIFWRHQIVGFTPYLHGLVQIGSQTIILTGTWFEKRIQIPGSSVTLRNGTKITRPEETFITGVKRTAPWWNINGNWPHDDSYTQSLVGTSIAKKLSLKIGDNFNISYQGSVQNLVVSGIVATGGFEEDQIFVTLQNAQRIFGEQGDVDRVLVGALIKPDDDLAKKDRNEMTPEEYVTWYCSPYIGVFTFQIEEVLPGVSARPIRQVAETEGKLLGQNQLLFTLIAVNSIAASGVTVASTTMASVLQRRREIGLMKAIGASNLQVATPFLLEACVIGLFGGVLGYPLGYILAGFISSSVFNSPTIFEPIILPTSILVAGIIVLVGSMIPIRKAVAVEAATVLRGE